MKTTLLTLATVAALSGIANAQNILPNWSFEVLQQELDLISLFLIGRQLTTYLLRLHQFLDPFMDHIFWIQLGLGS